MAHPKQKRKRCIASAQRLAPKIGTLKAFRTVADQEDISYRTVQRWHYEEQKRLRQEAEQQKRSPPSVTVGKSKVSRPGPPQPPPDPPPPAKLLVDAGELRCSRCSSKFVFVGDDDVYRCRLCGILEFGGFISEKTSPYMSHGAWSWML